MTASPVSRSHPSIAQSAFGTVLAFDFGTRRVGVAVGESVLRHAHPLAVIGYKSQAGLLVEVAHLIAEWRPGGLVVGLPIRLDDAPHDLDPSVRRFAARLERHFHLPVELIDERFTSSAADEDLHNANAPARYRREWLDAQAARLILEAYFAQAQPPLP
jgi:putative holliday junction resolvase